MDELIPLEQPSYRISEAEAIAGDLINDERKAEKAHQAGARAAMREQMNRLRHLTDYV